MNSRSKSTLFLIEQLIVVAVFAICAIACVRILTTAYFHARDSRDIGHALIVAENAAESFKAVSGDLEMTASLVGGMVTGHTGNFLHVVVNFDQDWHVANSEDAHYVLLLSDFRNSPNPRLALGRVLVTRSQDDAVLVSFEVAARRGGGFDE